MEPVGTCLPDRSTIRVEEVVADTGTVEAVVDCGELSLEAVVAAEKKKKIVGIPVNRSLSLSVCFWVFVRRQSGEQEANRMPAEVWDTRVIRPVSFCSL